MMIRCYTTPKHYWLAGPSVMVLLRGLNDFPRLFHNVDGLRNSFDCLLLHICQGLATVQLYVLKNESTIDNHLPVIGQILSCF